MDAGEKIPVPPHLQRLDRDFTIHHWRTLVRRLRCDPSVKLVAFAAVSYGNKDGTRIHPGAERLANVCNIDDRTVRMALGKLRGYGLLHRVVEGSRFGRRGGISDEYVATVPDDISSLPLLPVDESDPVREAKREAKREADRKRKQRRSKPGPTQEHRISDPEHRISDTGTPDLNDRIPVSEIRPPVQRPVHRPSHDEATIPLARERDRAAAQSRTETFESFAAAHRRIFGDEGEELTDEDEQWVSSTTGQDYVRHVLGGIDDMEESTVDGMLSNGAHPKTVVNKLLKDRGESAADYSAAQFVLLSVPDDLRQACMAAAEQHADTHFPDAGHRFRIIFAARLAQRRNGS